MLSILSLLINMAQQLFIQGLWFGNSKAPNIFNLAQLNFVKQSSNLIQVGNLLTNIIIINVNLFHALNIAIIILGKLQQTSVLSLRQPSSRLFILLQGIRIAGCLSSFHAWKQLSNGALTGDFLFLANIIIKLFDDFLIAPLTIINILLGAWLTLHNQHSCPSLINTLGQLYLVLAAD